MAPHHERAKQLRDEYERLTGVRPPYPRSGAALLELRKALDRYRAALVRAADARRQAETDFADEFTRLGQIDAVDDFDLDAPTSAGELEGEAGRLLRRAKAAH